MVVKHPGFDSHGVALCHPVAVDQNRIAKLQEMNIKMLKCPKSLNKKRLRCVIIDSGLSYKKSHNDDVVGGVELRIHNNRVMEFPCFLDDRRYLCGKVL